MNGQQFKAALDRLGLSLSDFATLMDVSNKTVSQWANNHAPVRRSVVLYLELRLSNLRIAEQLAQRSP